MDKYSPVLTNSYDPLKAGSIDGTDDYPHDKAIAKALVATYKPNRSVKSDPERTIFVSRLNPQSTEEQIVRAFENEDKITNIRLVRDIVTGFSKCYCFIEFEEPYQARNAIKSCHKMTIDNHEVLVDYEYERTMKGWIPRRLGGGLGGRKESGQLRFGCKDRVFRRPIIRNDVEFKSTEKSGGRSTNRDRRRSRSRSQDRSRRRGRNRSSKDDRRHYRDK